MSDEARIRERHAEGDFDGATTEALRMYGRDMYSLLLALHHNPAGADDAFSLFSERLWRSMDGFAFRCSMRTWCYRLARAASVDVQRVSGRRNKRLEALPEGSRISLLVAKIRTETQTFLRTETKSEMQKLRESLKPEDQLLLVLRIDRDLPWDELARVFLGEDHDDADARKREAARLRKRFQLVKKQLTKLAQERGLLDRRNRA